MFRPATSNVKTYRPINKENKETRSKKVNGTIILETKLKAMRTTNIDHRTERHNDDG